MSEEIDKHVLRKYEIQQKLGKGVRPIRLEQSAQREQPSSESRRKIDDHPPHLQAYGIVWKAVDKKTRDTVALKKIFDAFQNATDAQVRSRRGVRATVNFKSALTPDTMDAWTEDISGDNVFAGGQQPRKYNQVLYPYTSMRDKWYQVMSTCVSDVFESYHRLLNVLKAENDRDIYLIFEYMETDLHAGPKALRICFKAKDLSAKL